MGARFREYMASMNKNRRLIPGYNDGSALELTLENVMQPEDLDKLSAEDKTEFNRQVKQWTDKVLNELVLSVGESGIEGTRLRNSIRSRIGQKKGIANRIGYNFERQGVYVHKGVGNGYIMRGDVVLRTAIGPAKPHERFAKPWFNPVLSAFMPDLDAIVGKYFSSAIINTVRIYIP